MPTDPPAAAEPSRAPERQAEPPEDMLWKDVLEKGSFDRDLNTAHVVRKYKETIQDQPLLRLIQDVHQRIGIYANILEDIKRHQWPGARSGGQGASSDAYFLRQKYEELGLVPLDHLPNPWLSEATDFVLKKLRRYGTLLLGLMATQAETIAAELKVSPSVTVTFEVELGLSPTLTVGVEREGQREARG